MITKGNLEKLQNEVIAQILTDDTAKRLKFTRLLPKKKLNNDSEYYTYFNQAVTLDEAIAKGDLGEVKPIAPGVSLQELNVRTPINKTVAINTFGGVVNIANNLFDKDIYSIINILKDISALIGTGIEKAAVETIMNSSEIATFNTSKSDSTYGDYGDFILDVQDKLRSQAGNLVDLNSMAVNYKSITSLKHAFYTSNIEVEPLEELNAYFPRATIDVLGTGICDGGQYIGDKKYIGIDYRQPPMTLLYTQTSGTTVAPINTDNETVDYYPIVEFMRKDIKDELPRYTKLFVQTRVGYLLNRPEYALKGNFRP